MMFTYFRAAKEYCASKQEIFTSYFLQNRGHLKVLTEQLQIDFK